MNFSLSPTNAHFNFTDAITRKIISLFVARAYFFSHKIIFTKFMMTIKAKRVSSSSNIIQSHNFHTQTLNPFATGNAFTTVTLYKFLRCFDVLRLLIYQMQTKMTFHYLTRLFMVSGCAGALLWSSCAIMIIYIFDHFHIEMKPKYFQNILNVPDVLMLFAFYLAWIFLRNIKSTLGVKFTSDFLLSHVPINLRHIRVSW
jgi:hypothetical protein